MDLDREGTPPKLRSSDFADLPPPERHYSERLLPEEPDLCHRRSLPPLRSRSPSPQPLKSSLVPGVLEDSDSASPKDKKKKKKEKKKKSRGSSKLSGSGDFPEGSPESPDSAGSLASSPIGLASMSSAARVPCKFGAGCYRKNPDHRRQYSHPGDPDHPDTPAPAADEAFPEEEGIAETPSTPLRSASGMVASGDVDLGGISRGVTFPAKSGDDSMFAVGGCASSLKPRSAADSEGEGIIESNVDVPDPVEAVAVTPIASSFATRTRCKFGDDCWNMRPDHRARFAHPGDPDHPATASAGASPSHSRPGDAGKSSTSAPRRADSEPVVHIDPEPGSGPTPLRGSEARPAHSPAPMVDDDQDEDDDEWSPRSAEIDFPDKARKRCGVAKYICIGLCLSLCLISPVIFLGIVLANMVHLREDEQLVEPTWDGGERVTNGPGTLISWPHLRRESAVKRQADRLSQLQFAVLVNRRTQVLRHQKGPGLLFLRAMEDLVEIKPLKKLQLTQYHRLVDQQTGDERIVRGPRTYAPEPLERIVQPACWSEQSQLAVVNNPDNGDNGLSQDLEVSALESCKMKCSGMESCESFIYCPGSELSCDYNGQLPTTTTTPTTTTPTTTTATTTANADNSSSDNSSDNSFENSFENSSENSSELSSNSVENSSELSHSSSTNPMSTTSMSTNPTSTNPTSTNPATSHCRAVYKIACQEMDPPEEAVMINAFRGIIVENKTSGLLRLVKAPGLFFPSAYEVLREWRHVKLIDELYYAVTKDMLTGATFVLSGPTLLMLEAHEELIKIGTKVVIKKDEFLWLVDKRTGAERIVVGPASVSPAIEEEMPEGVQKAALLDPLTSAILLDQSTGQQQLKVNAGILAPNAYQTILEVRPKVRVLDHQAAVSRAPDGQLTLHTGSFFLAPYHEIFSMQWSVYADYAEEPVPKMNVSVIDLHVQRLPWRYIAITSDSVRIRLAGNTFWTVSDALRMATSTEDAPSDVAQRSKAKLLSNIAKVNFRDFMASMTTIMDQTSLQQAADAFYADRGLAVSRVEIVGFEAADDVVAAELRKTVVEVAAQVNRMMQAQTLIDVSSSSMSANIRVEKLRTDLIQQKAVNDLLLAMNEGAKEGTRMAEEAKTFLTGLEDSINETESRVDLYRRYHEHDAVNELTRLFSDGPASFYLHANETDIVLANFRSEL